MAKPYTTLKIENFSFEKESSLMKLLPIGSKLFTKDEENCMVRYTLGRKLSSVKKLTRNLIEELGLVEENIAFFNY